jgi:hypothetical protein
MAVRSALSSLPKTRLRWVGNVTVLRDADRGSPGYVGKGRLQVVDRAMRCSSDPALGLIPQLHGPDRLCLRIRDALNFTARFFAATCATVLAAT